MRFPSKLSLIGCGQIKLHYAPGGFHSYLFKLTAKVPHIKLGNYWHSIYRECKIATSPGVIMLQVNWNNPN